MTERDSRILPGPTAAAFENARVYIARAGIISWGLGVLWSILSPIVFRTTHLVPYSTVFIGAFLTAMLVHFLVGRAGRRVRQAEFAAGYTTLLDRYEQFDGIDARTGLVVRPAVVTSTSTVPVGEITSGSELGAVDGVRTPLGIVVRMPFAVAGTVLALGVTVVSFASIGTNGPLVPLVIVGAVFGSVAVILIPTLTLAILPVGVYVARLQQAFPLARVYAGGVEDGVDPSDLLDHASVVSAAAHERMADYLVFRADSLVLFSRSRTQLLPFLNVPRSRIQHAEATSIPQDRGPDRPALAITVAASDGHRAILTLPLTGSPGLYSMTKLAGVVDWAVKWAHGTTT